MAIGTVAAIALGAGALGSAAISSSASSKASKAASQAADQSAAVQREQLQAAQNALSPYNQAGLPATGAINSLLSLSGDPNAYDNAFANYRKSTGYDFRLNQGLNAVKSGFAGSGTLQSGAAMKSLNDYGQGMASQEFGNYLGALGNQQGLGLSAGSALAGVGQNYANSLAQINSNKADAIGNSALLNARNMNTMFNGLATGILGR